MKVEKIAKLCSGRREAMDVAGALAMMKDCEIGKLVLLARVNGDHSSAMALVEILTGLLIGEHKRRADQLARLIALEAISPKVCEACEGRKWVYKFVALGEDCEEVQVEQVPCEECSERGFLWRSSRSRARDSGVAWETWRRNKYSETVEAWVLMIEKEVGHAQKKFSQQ